MISEVTTKELSQILGISDRQVQNHAAAGLFNKLSRGKFDLCQCVRAYLDYKMDDLMGNSEELTAQRTALLKKKNKLADLEIKEKEGELVNYEKIRTQVFGYARIFRDTMLTLPDRLAPILAAEQDRNKIHNIMTLEIRSALEEAAKNTI